MKTLIAAALVSATLGMSSFAEEPLPPQPLNLSFEEPAVTDDPEVRPDHWFWFSSTPEVRIGITDGRAKAGTQSCKLTAQEGEDAYQGIAQRFSATPGHSYTFSVFVMNCPQSSMLGDSYGQISIEWQDAGGNELTRQYGPAWSHELPFSRWTRFVVEAQAPDLAVAGVVVITFFSRNSGGYGTFYVDDCGFSSRSGPPL